MDAAYLRFPVRPGFILRRWPLRRCRTSRGPRCSREHVADFSSRKCEKPCRVRSLDRRARARLIRRADRAYPSAVLCRMASVSVGARQNSARRRNRPALWQWPSCAHFRRGSGAFYRRRVGEPVGAHRTELRTLRSGPDESGRNRRRHERCDVFGRKIVYKPATFDGYPEHLHH